METPKYDFVHIFDGTEKLPSSPDSKESGVVTRLLARSHDSEVESGKSSKPSVMSAVIKL